MKSAVAVRGTLRFPDGTPAKLWTVRGQGDDGGGGFVEYKITDEQGRYEVMAPQNQTIHLNAEKPNGKFAPKIEKDWIAAPKLKIATGDGATLVHDFTLEKGTRISGRATVGANNEPIPNTSIHISCQGERSWWWARTQANGTYEFWIAPGQYELLLQSSTQPMRSQITVEKGVAQTVNFHVEQGRAAANTVKTIRGKVVLGDDATLPVAGATVRAMSHDFPQLNKDVETDVDGNFTMRTKDAPLYVEVVTPDGNFGKIAIVQPTENEFIVSLELTATARGKIMDSRTGLPAAGRSVEYSIRIPDAGGQAFMSGFKRETKTNDKGEYELRNLPTGGACDILHPGWHYGESEADSWTYVASNLNLKPNEDREIKDFSFDSRPHGLNEYMHQTYNAYHERSSRGSSGQNPIVRRFEVLLERGKRDGKSGVFAIMVRDNVEEVEGKDDPEQKKNIEALANIYETLFKDDDMFAQTERFYMMCVRMQPKEEQWSSVTAGMAKGFVESRKIDMPLPSLFSFAFFDLDGKLLGMEAFRHTTPALEPKPVPVEMQKQQLMEILERY
jgi:hypothetical protein